MNPYFALPAEALQEDTRKDVLQCKCTVKNNGRFEYAVPCFPHFARSFPCKTRGFPKSEGRARQIPMRSRVKAQGVAQSQGHCYQKFATPYSGRLPAYPSYSCVPSPQSPMRSRVNVTSQQLRLQTATLVRFLFLQHPCFALLRIGAPCIHRERDSV